MPGHWTDFLDPESSEDRLLPWKAVQRETCLSRTTAWRLQKSGEFPPSVVLSPGRVGYRQREIDAWKRSRVPRGEMDPPLSRLPIPATPKPCAPANPEPRTANTRGRARARTNLFAAAKLTLTQTSTGRLRRPTRLGLALEPTTASLTRPDRCRSAARPSRPAGLLA